MCHIAMYHCAQQGDSEKWYQMYTQQWFWDIYTATAASRVASGKNCQAKPYKYQQLELWQWTLKWLEWVLRRPAEVLSSRDDTVQRSMQEFLLQS